MSIRTMARVWEQSKQKGSALLLMLAIADFANDSGYAWPSVTTLAEKARVSERAARYLIRHLEASGELGVKIGGGRLRHLRGGVQATNYYRILVGSPTAKGGAELSPPLAKGGANGDKGGATAIAPEPSVIRQKKKEGNMASPEGNGNLLPLSLEGKEAVRKWVASIARAPADQRDRVTQDALRVLGSRFNLPAEGVRDLMLEASGVEVGQT